MVTLHWVAAIAASLVSTVLAAPTTRLHVRAPEVVESGYIIKLKSDVADSKLHLNWVENIQARSLFKRDLHGIERQFNVANFHGYSGRFSDDVISQIESSPEVAYVEKDQVVSLDYVPGYVGRDRVVRHVQVPSKRDLVSQNQSSWGLAAISHRNPGSKSYIYDSAGGTGMWAYVIDSGIRLTHEEFEGRATFGWTAYPGDEADTTGHGTHVAGTIAGKTFGVSKKAKVISVKVFQGQFATVSSILGGIQWTFSDIVAKCRKRRSVVNMSLGGDYSRSIDELVTAGSSQGIISVVAAGNLGRNATGLSPASTPSAITVGAVNADWEIATAAEYGWGSNYGESLDIFGPGVNIPSAGIESDTSVRFASGTSMATPHVAGLVLYFISVDGITGVQPVTDRLLSLGTKDVVGGPLQGSPNLLAYNGNA